MRALRTLAPLPRRTAPAAVAVLASLVGGGAALAQSQGEVRVRLVPNAAGAQSRLEVDARGQTAQSGGGSLRAVELAIARGFRFDPRSRARRCSEEQARAFSCPEESRIGRGEATVNIRGPLLPGGRSFTSTIDLFLAPRERRSDIGGVFIQAREQSTGFRASARGRLVPLDSRRYGSALRFSFPATQPLPPGFTFTLERLTARVGASRRVAGRRRSLITNPPVCPGAWPYRLRLRFSDRTVERAGAVACSAGAVPRFTG